MWPLAVLAGGRINEGFFFIRKCMVVLRAVGSNNEVTVLPMWP